MHRSGAGSGFCATHLESDAHEKGTGREDDVSISTHERQACISIRILKGFEPLQRLDAPPLVATGHSRREPTPGFCVARGIKRILRADSIGADKPSAFGAPHTPKLHLLRLDDLSCDLDRVARSARKGQRRNLEFETAGRGSVRTEEHVGSRALVASRLEKKNTGPVFVTSHQTGSHWIDDGVRCHLEHGVFIEARHVARWYAAGKEVFPSSAMDVETLGDVLVEDVDEIGKPSLGICSVA